ncbi:hypothetical protein [Candidatus Synechococcus calcipolaris]|nr:hypothetical protein [Candidatus Synechococcus calcipolaris]
MYQRLRNIHSRLRLQPDQGFTLPLVVGMGLVMMLIGVTMMLRSQTQTTTASAQRASEQSVAIAEVGLTRIQDFFTRNRAFLREDIHPEGSVYWAGESGAYLDDLGCNNSHPTYVEAEAFNESVPAQGGQFRIIRYQAPGSIPGTGTLTLQGETLMGNQVRSSTRLELGIPVSRSIVPSMATPELWAQDYTFPGAGTQVLSTASTQIVEAKCGNLGTLVGGAIADGQVTSNPALSLPSPLASPIPAGDPYDLGLINTASGVTTILPRPADTPNGLNGEYIYRGRITLTTTGTSRVIVKPGERVTLYLSGDLRTALSAGGSSTTRVKIGHDCTDTSDPPDGMSNGATVVTGCSPSNFKIIGTSATNEISFASRHTAGLPTTTEAVIIAPNALVRLGQANYTTRFKGMIWAREIDLSQGTTTVEPVPVAWTTLQPTLPPLNPPGSVLPLGMDSISKWERKAVTP